MLKTYVDSEEIAEIDAPRELVEATLEPFGGAKAPGGQYQLGEELLAWLRTELDV